MLVLDAGAGVRLLLDMPSAAQIWDAFATHGHDVHTPELFDVEVLGVLRKLVLRHDLPPARADQAVADLADLDLSRHPHGTLLARTWELRANVTPYDGLYVALGESLGDEAALVTTDARLARSVRQQTSLRVLDLAA